MISKVSDSQMFSVRFEFKHDSNLKLRNAGKYVELSVLFAKPCLLQHTLVKNVLFQLFRKNLQYTFSIDLCDNMSVEQLLL